METIALPSGSFVDKQLRLQIDSKVPQSFLLTNGLHMAMGLAPLETIYSVLSSVSQGEKVLVVAIISRPVVFCNGLPYALEGDYLTGLLSGETLSAMERRLVALVQRLQDGQSNNAAEVPSAKSATEISQVAKEVSSNCSEICAGVDTPSSSVVALADAFPSCARLAFPTGSDTDSDPPMEFLDQFAKLMSTFGDRKVFLIGDADSPGPLSVVLAALRIMAASKSPLSPPHQQDICTQLKEEELLPQHGNEKTHKASSFSGQSHHSAKRNTQAPEHVDFERISIMVGSIPDGMAAKLCVDRIFANLYFKENFSHIRTPTERILHHHSLGNLDAAATWLGRYAALILFAHWRDQKSNTDRFLPWASATMPDLVFGQLQAFSKRPASSWLFRPLPSPANISDIAVEEERLSLTGTPNAANRIKSGLPLILHSSALIMKRDADEQRICRIDADASVLNLSHHNAKRNLHQKVGNVISLIGIGQMSLKHQREWMLKFQEISDQFCQPILWLNLRGEPYVHIGEESIWSLRDEATAKRHLRAFVGVPATRLAEIEDRIAEDLRPLLEACVDRENFFFFEERSGMVPSTWPQGTIRSPTAAVIEARKVTRSEIHWKRIPLPGDTKPAIAHIVAILEAAGEFFSIGGNVVMVQCRSGRQGSRSSFCMALLLVLLAHEEKEETYPMPTGTDDDPKIVALVRAAPHGRAAWQLVSSVVAKQLGGGHFSRTALHAMRSGPRRHGVVISRLFLLVMVASFLLDERPCRDKFLGERFGKWLTLHLEMMRMYAALLQSTTERLAMHTKEVFGLDLGLRGVSVMDADHILKDAHFIGCHRLPQAVPRIAGAPNFRIKKWCGRVLAGTGIPSLLALPAIARAMMEATDCTCKQRIRLLWINLREEPVLYLGPGPFSLVEACRPFQNIVTTGISARDVERIEGDLVALVKEEVDREKSVLVHGEVEEDDCGLTQHAYRLSLQGPADVRTPREALSTIEGVEEVVYFRIPISDEQAPLPHAFDEISAVLDSFWNAQETTAGQNGTLEPINMALFHCQMGRGRTTTGLVLCALMLLKHEHKSRSSILSNAHVVLAAQDLSAEDMDNAFAPVRGLVDMLENGAAAKRIVDYVINSFDDVQNLRLAIPKLSDHLALQVQYLERYFYLICFGHYLFFDRLHDHNGLSSSFEAWLLCRPHVAALARRIRPKDL